MAANYGGHDHSFVDEDLDRFTCNTICTKVARDPHISSCCGQVFCESCLNYWFAKHHKQSCPHCRAEGQQFIHFLDKRLKREIDSLRIYCPNNKEGCQWVGEIGSLKDHLESDNGCGYVEVECPNKCKDGPLHVKKMKRQELENHLKNECYLRPYQCEHCRHKDTYQNITGHGGKPGYHYKTCLEFPLKCTNYGCGKEGIKRKDMEKHNRHCQEELVWCPNRCLVLSYPSHLTEMKILVRKEVENHLQNVCDCRPYQCEHCGHEDSYKMITGKGVFGRLNMSIHYNKCPEFPLECPRMCGVKDIKRKDMNGHRSQCPEEPVQCPFAEAGCKEKLVRRKLEQHTLTPEQLQKHLVLVMGAYKETKQELQEMKKILTAKKY